MVEEIQGEAIQRTGFPKSHLVDNFLNLLHSNCLKEHFIVLFGHGPRDQISNPGYVPPSITSIVIEDIREVVGTLLLYFPSSLHPTSIWIFELVYSWAISILEDQVVE